MTNRLNLLLSYKNQEVVSQFCHLYPQHSLPYATELFHDLLGWFWLRAQREGKGKSTYLFGPLLVLDDLWHVFILNTRAYIDFSMHFFGEYVHHDPEPIGFEHHLSEDELRDFIEDCFLYLDEDWVMRRFASALVQDTQDH
jgi:hypothetical protein